MAKCRSSLLNTSSKILMEDIQNGKVFENKRNAFKRSSSRRSNFLSVEQYSTILPESR